MTYTRKIFTIISVAVGLVFLGFAVTSTPFPLQTIAVTERDMVDPVTMTGVWDLAPEQAGVQDLTSFIPIRNFAGPSASYRSPDGLFVVTFATNEPAEPGTMVAGTDGELWALELGPRRGRAAVWDLGAGRTAGVAVWQTTGDDLPADTDVVLAALNELS